MEDLKYRILNDLNDYLQENEILVEDEEHLQIVLKDFYKGEKLFTAHLNEDGEIIIEI